MLTIREVLNNIMNKSNKLYKKAFHEFQNGNIDKAINLCDISLKLNIRNRAALNFKGLLHYLKGDLENAISFWKLDYKMNKSEVSKKYLEGTPDDRKRLEMYVKAVRLVNKLKINEAVKLLEECRKSDYNKINVNNYLAYCYIKLGQFSNADICLGEVLKIDRNNEQALNYRKETKKYTKNNKNCRLNKPNSIGKLFSVICIIGIVIFSASLGVKKIGKYYNKNNKVLDNNKNIVHYSNTETKYIAEDKVGDSASKNEDNKIQNKNNENTVDEFKSENKKENLDKSLAEKQFTVMIGDEEITLFYEDNKKKRFTNVLPETVVYEISPSKKNILFIDKKNQDMILVDISGNRKNITNKFYEASNGKKYTKADRLSKNPKYIWCASPIFIDEDNIVYISQLPWFNKGDEKFLWIYNIDKDFHKNLYGVSGKTIVFDSITEHGFKLIVDGREKSIKKISPLYFEIE